MTKRELIEFLAPFADETEIGVAMNPRDCGPFDPIEVRYAIAADGWGRVAIDPVSQCGALSVLENAHGH